MIVGIYAHLYKILLKDKNRLYLTVINYQDQKEIDCPIVIRGVSVLPEVNTYELSGPDVMARNDFENPENIKITAGMIKNAGSKFSYGFPPHSCTVIELQLRQSALSFR